MTSPERKTEGGSLPKIEVFDPAMCCSTGVCGPSIDPSLVRFAGTLEWLRAHGAEVDRHNLSDSPKAFTTNRVVRALLKEKGTDCLPVVFVDGKIAWTGAYPERIEMAKRLGMSVPASQSIYTEQVAELVALGAAVASNCEPCFRFHYDHAKKLGILSSDMRAAIQTANAVKATPARSIEQLVERYLSPDSGAELGPEAAGSLLPMATSKKCC